MNVRVDACVDDNDAVWVRLGVTIVALLHLSAKTLFATHSNQSSRLRHWFCSLPKKGVEQLASGDLLQVCPLLHWCRRGSSLHRGTPTCWPGTPPPSQTSSSTKCSTEDCRWPPSSLPPSSLFTLALLYLVTNGYLFAFFPGPIYILFSEMFKVCSDFLFLVFPIFPVFCDINHPLDIWLFL